MIWETRFLLRFLLLTYIICVIWKVSFFEGYLIAYIKLANRKRNVLVFPFCQNKNLQIWALFIVLEIKQIMSNICRWYVFLCKNHFPTQNLFSDAEVGEDVVENLGGGDDATGDVGKGIETLTEVFAQKVVGDVHLKTIKNPGDALLGLEERGIVTG